MNDIDRTKRMQRIMEQLARMGSADLEGVRQDMRDQGKDPNAIRERGIAYIKRLKGELRLSAAGAKRQDTTKKLEKIRAEVRRKIQDLGEDAGTLIRRLTTGPESELSVSFRKVESLSEEEVLDLLTEAQLLELLEEMDEEGN
jgi:hypothetical protein